MKNKITELIKLLEVEIDTHETAHKIMEGRFDMSAERKAWKSISVLVAEIKQASKTETNHEPDTKALALNGVVKVEPNICPDCHKYKKPQHKGHLHSICACGETALVCAKGFYKRRHWCLGCEYQDDCDFE
jgi:hypothetical protein